MKETKKNQFSKTIVTAILILNIAFAIAVFVVFWHTSSEPSALVAAWFSFTTIELWSLAGIKKKKLDSENSNVEREDEFA